MKQIFMNKFFKNKIFMRPILWGSLFGLLSFYVAGCDGISIQDPAKIFADGKWPEILKKLKDQLLELRHRDDIVKRVQQDKKRSDLMRVAVMDCGVDYTNPDLVNVIAFDLNGQNISGAGYDVMGKDNWASPNIIDPSLFAFGAKDILDSKIVGAPANPLDVILSINEDFEKTLKQKIMSDPDLATSFFAKLTNGSLTILGARTLLVNSKFEEMVKSTLEERVKQGLEAAPLLSPNSVPVADSKKTDWIAKDNHQRKLESWLTYAKLPWSLDTKTGMPVNMMGYSFVTMEHFDKFALALKSAYSEVEERQQFTHKFEIYKKFLKAWTTDSVSIDDSAIEKISKALAFKQYGPSIQAPVRKLILSLRGQILSELVKKGGVEDWKSFSLSRENVSAALDSIILSYKNDLLKMQAEPDLQFEKKATIKSDLDALPQLQSLKDWFIKNHGWEKNSLADENKDTLMSSLYRKMIYRSSHPFLDSNSASTSHGTHVSGIIASQDPNIRIYPIRVLTQGVSLPESEKLQVADLFSASFANWLQDPLVFKAVLDLMKPIGEMVGDQDLLDKKPERFAAKVLKLLGETIRADIVQDSTNYLFVNDVIKAIKDIGQQKFKVANVSLGAEFNAPVVNPKEANPQRVLSNTYEFLKFEYFKYQVGSAIIKYAPKTVFVIANGNSSKWVDGRSNSALPVDLSSSFLEKYENKKLGSVAPNNQIKNVIGVGSLATDGKLSSFTNLMISKKTPFVMAEGESVLSSVRMTDSSPTDELFESYLAKLSRIGGVFQEIVADESDSEKRSKRLHEQHAFMEKQRILKDLVYATRMEVAFHYSDHRALMSGTSMASPTVAGLIAKDLIAQAKDKGLNADELYDHPEFSPEQVIKATLSRAKKMKGDLYIPLRALTGAARPEHGESVKSLTQALDLLKTKNDASGFNAIQTLQAPQATQALHKKKGTKCQRIFAKAG